MRSTAASLFIGCVLLVSARAQADKQDDEARMQFERGVELFDQGKFEQAAIAFERAYELKPSYRILFNIAQSENELGHYAAALKAYVRYLADGGDEVSEDRVKQVKREIERLNTLVGMILIECPHEGAKVKVDKEVVGRTPLAGPIFVDIGKHEIQIKKGNEELLEEVVKVAGGERVRIKVEGAAEAKGAGEVVAAPPVLETAEEEPEEPAVEAEPEAKRVWTWVAFGLGGGAAVGAAITGGLTLSKRSEVIDQCEGKSCPSSLSGDFDQVKTLSITTDVLIGVAAVGVVTGVLLYFFEPESESEEGIAVSAAASANGGGVSVGGRF